MPIALFFHSSPSCQLSVSSDAPPAPSLDLSLSLITPIGQFFPRFWCLQALTKPISLDFATLLPYLFTNHFSPIFLTRLSVPGFSRSFMAQLVKHTPSNLFSRLFT
jgi:hypothetical protein